MKVRISEGCLRVRLSDVDLNVFSKKGKISNTLVFPSGGSITTILETGTTHQVSYEESQIIIKIPTSEMTLISNQEEIGTTHVFDLPNGKHLQVIVEKDLQRRKS